MTDGFTEVPLGRAGTGEAVILPQNQQFTNFSRDVLRLRMKEEEEKKQREADLVGMLNDKDLAAKWTEDAIKQFIPKREAFEKEAIDIFKQTNGRLSPVQWFELKSKFGKLKQEVALNNELYNRDMDRVKELQKDLSSATPVFDHKVSKELRKAYSNPWSDPEYAADIQKNYGGDVNAWRAANQGMFENVRAFSPADYIKKKFNDKVSEEYVMDEQGRPVSQTTAEGRKFFTKRKFVPQEKIEAEVNTAFSGNTYDDTRFREHYQRKAGEVPINYSATGPLSMDEEGWKDPKEFTFMADAISKAPELASMKPEQQKQWVAKKLAAYDVGVNFPESRAVDFWDPRKTSVSVGGGGNKKTEPANIYDTAKTNVPNAIKKISDNASAAQGINQSFEAMGFKSPGIKTDQDIARTNIDVPANVTDKVYEMPVSQVKALDAKNQPAEVDQTQLKKYGITNLPLRVASMSAAYTRNEGGYPRLLTAKEVKQRGANNVAKTVTARYEIDIPALKKALGRDNILEKLAMQGVTGAEAQAEADILVSNATKLLKIFEGKKLVRYFNLENAMDVSDLDQNYSDKANTAYKQNQKSTAQEQGTTTIDLDLDN
jgi:hypothetical protein